MSLTLKRFSQTALPTLRRRIPAYIRLSFWLTMANMAVLFIRNVIVGDHVFCFLRSNLFIGSLPVLVLAIIIYNYWQRLNGFLFWALTLLWILFYPNAPYMISDLIHNSADPANNTDPTLVVYDTMVIFSITMLSLFYGFLSLKMMFAVFRNKYSHRFAHVMIGLTLVLSCLGFYMGREMKSVMALGNGYLYSWELFLEPASILKAVWNLLFPIGVHWPAYLMMMLFGIVQGLLLLMFKSIGDIESDRFMTPSKTPDAHE